MAATNISAPLLDELIGSITGLSPSADAEFVRLRRTAISSLKESKAGRTNQFSVLERYHGLEEKARVVNYGELEDALSAALSALLDQQNQLTPEFLSLLLELADDPVNKTSVEDLQELTRTTSPGPLTWDDILKDDPIEDPEIWQNVNFADDSSSDDDGASVYDEDPITSDSELRSVSGLDDSSLSVKAFELQPDHDAASRLKELHAQFDFGAADLHESLSLSQTRIIREIIFLLSGLPCNGFKADPTGVVNLDPQVNTTSISTISLNSILGFFVELANQVVVVRRWVSTIEQLQLVQAFQFSLDKKLKAIDRSLADLQLRIIKDEGGPVTLLSVTTEMERLFENFLPFTNIVKQYLSSNRKKPFQILENLFDLTTNYQEVGNSSACRYTATVFFDTMKAYSKPFKRWMTTGDSSMQGSVFFVKESEAIQPLQNLWSDQFSLIYDENGNLNAPRFLRLSTTKVFNTGKSVRFLRALGALVDEEVSNQDLDIGKDILKEGVLEGFVSFERLFHSSFDSWVESLHQSASDRLRKTLDLRCGLGRDIDALEYMYFGSNCSISARAYQPFFDGIETGKRGWDNGVILTGLFRDAFSELRLDVRRISVRVVENDSAKQISMRSMAKLECLELLYKLPWSSANIIKQDSIQAYQQVFILRLQVQRAKDLLDRKIFRDAGSRKFRVHTHSDSLESHLTHRLRWYVNELQAYHSIVLPLLAQSLRNELSGAEDVDEMISAYLKFKRLLELRTTSGDRFHSTRQAIVSLLDLVAVFCDASFNLHYREEDCSVLEKFEKMVGSFTSLLSFALSGIRSLSRTEGDEFLAMLAEKLAFGLESPGKRASRDILDSNGN